MTEESERRVLHGERFLMSAGVRLRAVEPVIVALPPEILMPDDRIGDVIHADDSAQIRTTEDKAGKTISIQILLEVGQCLEIGKSCEVMFLSAFHKQTPTTIAFQQRR